MDYPGVGPEHAAWHAAERVEYSSVSDEAALQAMQLLARTEGILCALETAHAVSAALCLAAELGSGAELVINLSGRGDKDMTEVARLIEGIEL